MPDMELYDTPDTLDICVLAGEPVMDDGLKTSSFISLTNDTAADGGPGWWGDVFNPENESPLGSRVGSIKKNSAENRVKAIGYTEDSHQWMIDQGVAKDVTATIEKVEVSQIIFKVEITEPDFNIETQRYSLNWDAQEIRGL